MEMPMIANDAERMQIALSLPNPYDYLAFKVACEAAGVVPLAFYEYAQKIEAVLAAIEKYPELPPEVAYLQLISDQGGHLIPPSVAVPIEPTTADMVVSAAKAALDFAASGFKIATEEERELRLRTCEGCGEWTGTRCKLCGCFTSLKALLASQSCPGGKW
jgi:hypothetical protein